ncbi:MAG: hypothetical protein M3R30_03665 [Candidatus Eremiobacteraeota bacterium]|nr:hypothetical protein [Candidatus Eremiobacteraeota bacterium]
MGNLTLRNLLAAALLGSLLLHGVGAYLVPKFAHLASLVAVETISFTQVKRIEITHLSTPPRPSTAKAKIVPDPHVAATPAPSAKRDDSKGTPPPAAPPASTLQVATQPVADNAKQSPQPPAPTPRATPSADVREPATTTNNHVASGFMPFGATAATPVLDPSARHQLEALNVHVTIVVIVGDDGRTKSVRFDPPIDKALEGQIQDLLASANWDPAYCGGGIPCEATATIRL